MRKVASIYFLHQQRILGGKSLRVCNIVCLLYTHKHTTHRYVQKAFTVKWNSKVKSICEQAVIKGSSKVRDQQRDKEH